MRQTARAGEIEGQEVMGAALDEGNDGRCTQQGQEGDQLSEEGAGSGKVLFLADQVKMKERKSDTDGESGE